MERRRTEVPGIPPPWSPACEGHPSLHPACCLNSNLCRMRKRGSQVCLEEETPPAPSATPEKKSHSKCDKCLCSEDQFNILLQRWLERTGAPEGGGLNAKERERCDKERAKMEAQLRKMVDKWKRKSLKFPPECRTKLMKAYLQKMLESPPQSKVDLKGAEKDSKPERKGAWQHWRTKVKAESKEESRDKNDPREVLEEVRQLVRSCKAQCFANYAKSRRSLKTDEDSEELRARPAETVDEQRCACSKAKSSPSTEQSVKTVCCSEDVRRERKRCCDCFEKKGARWESCRPPEAVKKAPKKPSTAWEKTVKLSPSSDQSVKTVCCSKVASSDEQRERKRCCDCDEPVAKVEPREPCCKCRPPEAPKKAPKKPSTAWAVEETKEIRYCTCDKAHVKVINITEQYLKASSEAQTELTSPMCAPECQGLTRDNKLASAKSAKETATDLTSSNSDLKLPAVPLLACTYIYPSSPKSSKSAKHPDPSVFTPVLKSFFNSAQS